MERYSELHRWMIALFFVIQVSIYKYYWPKFGTTTWEFHIHYWLVTAWYLLLIIQPYLISISKIQKHRTIGILGFLLAGGVIFTGFSLLDVPLKLAGKLSATGGGPPLSFYYGTLIVEFLLMVAFAYAVIRGILHRKNLAEHSWWLIASAFYMMMPAVGRGLILFWRGILPPEKFHPMIVFITGELIYIPLFLLFAYKFGKIKHQATYIGLLLVIVRFLRIPLGASETIQEILKAMIRFQ